MAEYGFQKIEKEWQKSWKESDLYKVPSTSDKPKYYILDMFPYPSGSGLHVGHPLGYIASDIIARYKRLKGFNVLHPMGFDSFGLPAEQHAIKTGQHPAISTEKNITRYIEQLSSLGFSYDWSREVRTSDPSFYKWTQWIFLKLYEKGLAYEDDTMINWCPNDKAVLANEEVKNGRCDRCNTLVVRRKLRQWILRITEYADRLIEDLDGLDWPESIKLSQTNWIGKSHGAELDFPIKGHDSTVSVYTTRPDTIYGATYMVIAPEHKLVDKITTEAQKQSVADYVEAASKKSDLERTELDKSKTGVFTGAYTNNPISGEEVPIWISDYVLISYGTGAIMAVPGGDQRDFEFAKKFDLPIAQVVSPDGKEIEDQQEAYDGKGIMLNSGKYDGMDSEECKKLIIDKLEKEGKGKGTVNYKLRDWIFTRQRYWGEPIPIIHCDKCGTVPVPEDQLPVILPEVESYLPTKDGQSPLAHATDWVNTTCPKCGEAAKRETNTMPQWGGSCWYYLRYPDPSNDEKFVDSEIEKYWMNVDFYIGGAEHAVLHLLYSRFWHKVLFDLGHVSTNEPFQKLVNQGMITGNSAIVNFVFVEFGSKMSLEGFLEERRNSKAVAVDVKRPVCLYISDDLLANDLELVEKWVTQKYGKTDDYTLQRGKIYASVSLVNGSNHLNIEAFKRDNTHFENTDFIRNNNGDFLVGREIEKMSKSKYNVVNPDDLILQYGADTLRMYEMFLGPIEQSKPWNTNGIEGVFKFLRKFWNLFHDVDTFNVSNEAPTKEELKTLHALIKKVEYDCENLSLNTSVSAFMIAVKELGSLKCNKRAILEPMTILLSPFAPHLAEEVWNKLGNDSSVVNVSFPAWDEKHLTEDNFEYPISVNGKMRVKLNFGLDMSKEDIEREVLANESVQKWTEGKPPKKVIVVHKRIVNVVV